MIIFKTFLKIYTITKNKPPHFAIASKKVRAVNVSENAKSMMQKTKNIKTQILIKIEQNPPKTVEYFVLIFLLKFKLNFLANRSCEFRKF